MFSLKNKNKKKFRINKKISKKMNPIIIKLMKLSKIFSKSNTMKTKKFLIILTFDGSLVPHIANTIIKLTPY